ncbi:uncharacterized protein N0V89_001262 [Didymosphaeria variabile]|uniref:Zn(2)-C6 fungal-type domain-containing protein n=1 Tax=Didymosphaeria variabile TaxID=1932322 RepID=A0A9W9CGK9_9PLEO|nr:uncharacterized protein N0V89_001262 [Didymosphaeria variabile]KAJ4360695.1 hypothetical protein N0V89_001262 [Didymosphaeria variabile]
MVQLKVGHDVGSGWGNRANAYGQRKVGCDRALPHCANCTRAKRECKGYGLKLAWPDKYDGRRKQKKYQAEPDTSATNYVTKFGEFYFLNTSIEDVEGHRYTVRDLVAIGCFANDFYAPRSLSPGLEFWKLDLGEREGTLLSYYNSVVARMITTIDDSTNGFRLEIMPMALTSTAAAATSLLQATLALASFHLGSREEALTHKVRAIKALADSFHCGSPPDERTRLTQFASCMMLCVYSVFDASDTSWHTHLQGARNVVTSHLRALPGNQHRCNPFLKEWYEYHHTFSEFAYPSQFYTALPSIHDILIPESLAIDRRVRGPRNPSYQCHLETDTEDKIVGLLGCSSELLRLISCINQLRTLLTMETGTSESDMTALAVHIRFRLLNLRQEIYIYPDETSGHISHTRIHHTAEFYQVAAMLYLYNTYPATAPSSSTSSPPNSPLPFPSIPDLVRKAFMLLDQMEVCTSPWPLFVVACNVSEDRDRIEIMRIFEEGSQVRRVGNYDVITGLVKAVWSRGDLKVDEGRDGSAKIPDWRELVDEKTGMPSFI